MPPSFNIEDFVSRHLNRWNGIVHTLQYEPGKETKRPIINQDHPVICISRLVGAGARVISQQLSQRLNYEIFGSNSIDEIAKDLRAQRSLIDSLDERAQSEVGVIIETWLGARTIEPKEYIKSLARVLQTLATQGGVIVLGRGGSIILEKHSALNILIIAPIKQRIATMMEYEQLDEKAARSRVETRDKHRAEFLKQHFKRDMLDSEGYDLVINTERITPDAAVELILKALESRGYPESRLKLPKAN